MIPKRFAVSLVAFFLGFAFDACSPETPDLNSWENGIGTGEPGWNNGSKGAQFLAPYGIATDAENNIYVTEQFPGSLGIVRKITAEGVVSTFAGSWTVDGFNFFRDGPSNTALFLGTFGVTTDNQNNVYVSDASNNRIRKIAAGNVSTMLYNANVNPRGVARDAQGNMYFSSGNEIKKLTSSGDMTTLAGAFISGLKNGPGESARFSTPFGIALDNRGNVYVADEGNDCIRKITPDGVVSTLAGTGVAGNTNGPANVAQFNSPTGVVTDAHDNVYVADMANNLIRKITPGGVVSTLAGDGSKVLFNEPIGIAINRQGSYLYVTDHRNLKVRRIKL